MELLTDDHSWFARGNDIDRDVRHLCHLENTKMLAGPLPASSSTMAAINRQTCGCSDPVSPLARAASAASMPIPLLNPPSQPAAKCSSCFSHRALKLTTHQPIDLKPDFFYFVVRKRHHFSSPIRQNFQSRVVLKNGRPAQAEPLHFQFGALSCRSVGDVSTPETALSVLLDNVAGLALMPFSAACLPSTMVGLLVVASWYFRGLDCTGIEARRV